MKRSNGIVLKNENSFKRYFERGKIYEKMKWPVFTAKVKSCGKEGRRCSTSGGGCNRGYRMFDRSVFVLDRRAACNCGSLSNCTGQTAAKKAS